MFLSDTCHWGHQLCLTWFLTPRTDPSLLPTVGLSKCFLECCSLPGMGLALSFNYSTSPLSRLWSQEWLGLPIVAPFVVQFPFLPEEERAGGDFGKEV